MAESVVFAQLTDLLTKIRRNSSSRVATLEAARKRLASDVIWADQALTLLANPTPPPPPSASVTQTFDTTGILAGRVAWEAKPAPASGVTKVEFAVDGVLSHTELSPPYVLETGGGYDTAQLSDGSHLFAVRVIYDQGGPSPVEVSETREVRNTVILPPPPPPPVDTGANLLWEDVFAGSAGSSPNPEMWNLRTGPNWENGTLQCTMSDRPENVSLDGDGHLLLTARRESRDGRLYTSVRMDTQGKRTITSGYLACSCRIETTDGSWPAFWTYGGEPWPDTGEIDVFEVFGALQRPVHHIHIPGADDGKSVAPVVSMESEFHEYGAYFDEDVVVFYIDRQETFRVERKATWPFGTRPQFPVFYINVGSWGGNPANGSWPVRMTVDWVRAWDRRPW